MTYTPRTVPPLNGDAETLAQWLTEELRTIAQELQAPDKVGLGELHVEPVRPREGMIVNADGTDWDPGMGQGAYVYSGGAWVYLNFVDQSIDTSHFLKDNVTATTTVGYTTTPFNNGTVSSGTLTPAAANGNYQYYTNNGAHTLAAPSADSAIDILVTNGASAGAITFSGFTVASGNTGDPLTTTNGNKFIIAVRRINAVSTYIIKALQ